ncbi:MAG: hypothetical protein ACRDBG_08190, partial [Waterburya sp.]
YKCRKIKQETNMNDNLKAIITQFYSDLSKISGALTLTDLKALDREISYLQDQTHCLIRYKMTEDEKA